MMILNKTINIKKVEVCDDCGTSLGNVAVEISVIIISFAKLL